MTTTEETTLPEPEDQVQGEAADEVQGDTSEDQGEVADEALEPWDSEKALAKIRKANQEAKRLRERAKAAEDKASKADGLEAQLEEARARAAKAEHELRVQRVLTTYGLPETAAKWLTGDTVEEMQENAQALLEFAQSANKPKPAGTVVNHEDPSKVSNSDIQKMVADLI